MAATRAFNKRTRAARPSHPRRRVSRRAAARGGKLRARARTARRGRRAREGRGGASRVVRRASSKSRSIALPTPLLASQPKGTRPPSSRAARRDLASAAEVGTASACAVARQAQAVLRAARGARTARGGGAAGTPGTGALAKLSRSARRSELMPDVARHAHAEAKRSARVCACVSSEPTNKSRGKNPLFPPNFKFSFFYPSSEECEEVKRCFNFVLRLGSV